MNKKAAKVGLTAIIFSPIFPPPSKFSINTETKVMPCENANQILHLKWI